MWKTEVTIFIILGNIVLLIFITGIILFIFQYRRRKLFHEKEKAVIEDQHKHDLLNTRLQASQRTMQFIGSEIHDSVAQKLTLASIYSQKLEFENQNPDLSERLKGITSIINDSLIELRELSRTLTDNRMQDTSLTDLLRLECDRINAAGVCKVVLEQNLQKEINVTAKNSLLRVVQEFIQNSLKHAECSLISISLTEKENGLSVIIADNGKGFDASQVNSRGIGLGNMNRRIQLLGGIFNLQSEPGKGTQAELFIPV